MGILFSDLERVKYLAWTQLKDRWLKELKTDEDKLEFVSYLIRELAELKERYSA